MELYGVARSWMNDEYIYCRNSSWMAWVGRCNVWATPLGAAAWARGNLSNCLLGAKLLGTNVITLRNRKSDFYNFKCWRLNVWRSNVVAETSCFRISDQNMNKISVCVQRL